MVIIAAELLKRGNELVKNGIHPTTIMSGYRLALKEAVKYIKSSLMVPMDSLGEDALMNASRTSMASKILNSDPDFWCALAVKAVKSVKTHTADGKPHAQPRPTLVFFHSCTTYARVRARYVEKEESTRARGEMGQKKEGLHAGATRSLRSTS